MNPQEKKEAERKATNIRTNLWKKNNKERVKEQSQRYYAKNKEKINLRGMLYSRNGGNLRRYGITLDQYNEILKSQNNVCAICHQPEYAKSMGIFKNLAVDHNHETGEVRGLLCSGCNRGIGYMKDNIEVLKSAYNYLIKHDK